MDELWLLLVGTSNKISLTVSVLLLLLLASPADVADPPFPSPSPTRRPSTELALSRSLLLPAETRAASVFVVVTSPVVAFALLLFPPPGERDAHHEVEAGLVWESVAARLSCVPVRSSPLTTPAREVACGGSLTGECSAGLGLLMSFSCVGGEV